MKAVVCTRQCYMTVLIGTGHGSETFSDFVFLHFMYVCI
jgi:hypothetical protein